MKIGLIVDSNLWECPYVNIYTSILNTYKVPYDLIVWDRDLSESTYPHRFSHKPNTIRSLKFFDYFRYARYIKKIIPNNRYEKLIVFGQATGIFLLPFLKKYYTRKYILDYRDVGIDRIILFKKRFRSLVNNSFCTVVSSWGFLQFLPKCNQYYISHNFNEDLAKNSISKYESENWPTNIINILTIGSIRDFESNSQILDALGNIPGFYLSFIGKGPKSEILLEYSKRKGYNNVLFKGKYEKSEERGYVADCSYINLFLPNYETHSTPMANRFYLALINKRPLIVTKNSTQGEYVIKYKLGVAIENTNNLCERLREWYNENTYSSFKIRCNELLKIFLKDQEIFKQKVIQFITQ